MAEISNLTFKVALDSAEFERRIKEMEAVAKAFNTSISNALDLTRSLNAAQRGGSSGRQATASAAQLTRLETKLLGIDQERLSTQTAMNVAKAKAGKLTSEEVRQLSAKLSYEKKSMSLADQTNSLFQKRYGLVSGLAGMAARYASAIGLVSTVNSLVRITGEFQAQHVALRAILQDVAGADRIYYQLQSLAVKSPFTFINLTSYAKQLSAFSVPMEEIYDVTKRLADVSAGLGVDMGRIILAYGQVRSAAYLRGQELRQFTEAGIPMLQLLADQFTELEGRVVGTGEVFDRISARQVSFEMVEEAFARMTSEGGKFYQMQEVLAETVKGKVSNLIDAWQIMLSEIGEANDGLIKGTLNGITNLINNYNSWLHALKGAVSTLLLYQSIMTAARLVETAHIKLLALNKIRMQAVALATEFAARTGKKYNMVQMMLIKSWKSGTKAAGIFKLTIQGLAGAVSLAVGLAVTLISSLNSAKRERRALTDEISEGASEYEDASAMFKRDSARVSKAYEEMNGAGEDNASMTAKFRDELDELAKKYPNIIDATVRQTLETEGLAAAWELAAQKMREYYGQGAADNARVRIESKKSEDQEAVIGKLRRSRWLRKREGMMSLAESYVTGGISLDELQLTPEGKELYKRFHRIRQVGDEYIEYDVLDELRREYASIAEKAAKKIDEAVDTIERSGMATTASRVSSWIEGHGMSGMEGLSMADGETVEAWGDRLRAAYASAADDVRDGISRLAAAFGVDLLKGRMDASQKLVSEYMKAHPAPDGVSLSGLTMTSEKPLTEWMENATKTMDADSQLLSRLPTSLRRRDGEGNEAWYERLEGLGEKSVMQAAKRLDYLKSMSESLYGDDSFGGSTKEYKQGVKDAKAADNARLKELKDRYRRLKEAKAWYDKIVGLGFSDETARALMGAWGWLPGGTALPTDWDEAFESLSAEAAGLSPEAAKDMEDTAAKERMEGWYEAAKAMKEYAKEMGQLAAEDKAIGYGGQMYDLSKEVAELESKYRDAERERDETARKLGEQREAWLADYRLAHEEATAEDAEAAWRSYYDGQVEEIDGLYERRKEWERQESQKRVDDMASSFVDGMLEAGNIDTSDLSGKTLAQLEAIVGRLRDALEGLRIPDGLREQAEAAGLSLDALLSRVQALLTVKIDDVGVEATGRRDDKLEALAGLAGLDLDLSGYEEAATRLAELRRHADEAREAFMDGTGTLEDWTAALEAAEEGEKAVKSQKVAAWAQLAGSAFSSMGEALSDAGEEMGSVRLQALGDALSEAGESISAMAQGFAQGGLVGAAVGLVTSLTDNIADLMTRDAVLAAKAREANEEYADSLRDIALAWDSADFESMFGTFSLKGGVDAMEKYREALSQYQEAVSGLSGAKVMTRHASWWEKNLSTKGRNEYEDLMEFAPELFKDGELDVEAAQALLDSGRLDTAGEKGDYNSALKEMIEDAIALHDSLEEADDALEDVISDYVGDLASDLSDKLWDAVADGADAWDDWRDAGADAIAELGKQMVSELIMQSWMDTYADRLKEAFGGGDWEGAAGIIEEMTEGFGGVYEMAYESTRKWQDMMASMGLDVSSSDSDSDTSLSDGIKSITEDTADLLASYVNAIRSDVSHMKSAQDQALSLLKAWPTQSPTLSEYLPKAEAHLSAIEASSAAILYQLKRVVTTESGEPRVAVLTR